MGINETYGNEKGRGVRDRHRNIKKKAKIVKPDKPLTFFDPKNIPKLKKIEQKINAMQIPKKWT
jgi:hypothetical protein